jgi:hypothetical protein
MSQSFNQVSRNPNQLTEGKFNRAHRKENHFYKEYKVITPALNEIISCRMYSTDRMNYCCIWVRVIPIGEKYATHSISGTGKVGGWGYHRESAAAHEAITTAGYTLEKSISGVGETALEEALISIAAFHGYPDSKLFTAHA